jgi:ParB-like chromosome segregation protein Spo0J
MQIENIKINDIKQYENNAKIHTEEQIEQIINSIQRYGNNDPIAIDENNVIIEGHGRYIALKRLGIEEIPVIKLKHLTEEQKREYILVHNKLTMNTGFDMEKLQAELELIDYDMTNFSFDNVNFNEDDLHDLFEDVEEEKKAKEKEVIICPHCGEVID